MKIVKLTAENIKRLKAVQIETKPPGQPVMVCLPVSGQMTSKEWMKACLEKDELADLSKRSFETIQDGPRREAGKRAKDRRPFR